MWAIQTLHYTTTIYREVIVGDRVVCENGYSCTFSFVVGLEVDLGLSSNSRETTTRNSD